MSARLVFVSKVTSDVVGILLTHVSIRRIYPRVFPVKLPGSVYSLVMGVA
jgi:hypothetical protein